jgi:hypothetical protein
MPKPTPQPGDRPRRLRPPRLGAAQLGWVSHNRSAPKCIRPVGVEIGRADVEAGGDDRRAREVFDAINALVDAPFRACCRFESFRGGTVRILVFPPEKHYDIRSVWQARLLRELAQNGRRGTIRKVVFAPLREDDADRPESGGVAFPAR